MTQATSTDTSPATRPPAFGPSHAQAAPTTAAATVASAIAASTFIFDARATKGEWPIPPMSADACDLLSRMLTHTACVSPTFSRAHHSMPVLPHEVERFDKALTEILGANFPLPVEGGTFPVPVIDRAVLSDERLLFHVNDTYAAHLKSIGAVPPAGVDLEVDIPPASLVVGGEAIVVDDGELTLLVASLQTQHFQRVAAWNFHAAERLGSGHLPEAPAAFGIPQAVALLRKLGAAPGGCGY